MSEEYREDTQGGNDSNEGSSSDHTAELETDDFVWEDVLEEIGRFENFNVYMIFTTKIVLILSASSYIIVKRLLNKASSESGPEFILPKTDLDADPLMDTNVTRSQSSSKSEQKQWNQATKRLALQCKELHRTC